MATVQSMNLARLLALEADTVIGGHIDGSGHLILEQHDETEIDAGAVLGSVPDASETVKGIVELATTAEAITGTDAVRAVTPDGLSAALAAFLTNIYPVGSIYMSTVSTNPNTLFGIGTWAAVGGRFLIGVNGTYGEGSMAGEADRTLVTGNLPAHTHATGSLVVDSQGSHQHNIGVDAVASGSGQFGINVPGSAEGGAGAIDGTFPSGSHTHTISGNTGSVGSGTSFSILPPFLAVYIWKRTA